ncbi:hypothetical protein [Rhizobium sp. S96]|uniref:hypothetical protein n=1 Tax=Rhizobium sp. S96 TaxID=3055140 RepID=UPI0025AB07CB|nr:hypothetical protein [Rhizobium sp. S96]MDM9621122.1 hypothetical protein [Rhizobium sp. S96]
MKAAEDVPIGARGDFKDGAVLRRLAGFKAWVNADHPVRANEIIGVYVDALQARLIGLHQIQLDYLAKNT